MCSGNGRLFFILVLAGLIVSCSGGRARIHLARLTDCREILRVHTPTPIRKACFNEIENTLYLLEDGQPWIHFYHNGKRINRVGGRGPGETQFAYLTDIGLAPDGDIIAVDAFRSSLSKIDRNGRLVSRQIMEHQPEPGLICVSENGTWYLYDFSRKEVFVYHDPASEPAYSFARFQLENPTAIFCNRDYFWVYEEERERTILFDSMGQLLGTETGMVQIDRQNRKVTALPSDKRLLEQPDIPFNHKWLFPARSSLIFTLPTYIVVMKPQYQPSGSS